MQCKVVNDKNDFVKCLKLGEHHYNEVERRFTGLPYKPKLNLFLPLFEGGHIECVALYDGAKVEGYVMVSIMPSLFSDIRQAQEIGLYVSPKYRGEGWFKQMLEVMEAHLSVEGVGALYLAFKKGFAHNLPDRYVEAETYYINVLEA